ncbi:aminoglycoside adenylyltransferase domain-containing protein [Paractinoplanes rishiriensis]|uniref:Aminoglycoside nucleotidyltransferase ANT9 n=1 Tax=Paractinoplanes rishiriensis TaxID=1050105 RepID=A0A919K347_9ACTN|nr:aminoglycoside adenylyltransferase domain-containing protein [Actinoplanes rishiriensis]GIE99343.1 aminoglycoside nucleotidyltransferase ANT9 [Actinoplanes rishiriensis]
MKLVDEIARIAGPALRSVILHGSLAAGGYRPERSDIDLLAVVEGGLSDDQIAALVAAVRRSDGRIDLQVVTAAVAAAPSPEPALELLVGRHDESAELEVEIRVDRAPDLLAELSMARADGRALAGAPPHEVLGEVPAAWVVARGRHWLGVWRGLTDDAGHAAFMVLTACRIWRFAVEGRHSPKIEAAEWVLARRPSLTAVRQAVRQYEDQPGAPVDPRGIADVLDEADRATRLSGA